MLRFPVVRLASLRFASLGNTVCACGFVRFFRRHRKQDDRPGVGNPDSLPEIFTRKQQGLPGFCGTPISICTCSSTPVGRRTANHIADVARLPLKRKRKLQRTLLFRSSIAWLLDSLSTLRSAGYPSATQDSLPAAGQALPGEISSLGSNERFQFMTS